MLRSSATWPKVFRNEISFKVRRSVTSSVLCVVCYKSARNEVFLFGYYRISVLGLIITVDITELIQHRGKLGMKVEEKT